MCFSGHTYRVIWQVYARGAGCPECRRLEREQKVVEDLQREGYCLKSRYQSNKVKINLLCPKGHQYIGRYSDFQMGSRCPECYSARRHNDHSMSKRT